MCANVYDTEMRARASNVRNALSANDCTHFSVWSTGFKFIVGAI